MKKIFLLFAFCLFVTGCGVRGLGGSFVGDLPEKESVSAIAKEAADFLSNDHAPGHTKVFLLTPEKDAQNQFSVLFEQELREKGYTILPESESECLTIAYTLDSLKSEDGKDVNARYLQLRTSEGVAFARSYDVNGNPEAGRSATPLKKGVLTNAVKKAKEKTSETFSNAKNAVEEIMYE